MRRLKIMEHISLDGVIQVSGDSDFPYGDWTAPYRSEAGRAAVYATHAEPFDLVLGRSTYDAWSGYWPTAPSSPLADRFNAATKYVATHRPESLTWGPAEGIGSDVIGNLQRIKASAGPDLILWGSSTITSLVFEHDLVDEMLLIVYPVLLGVGKRLFASGTPPRSFKLLSTKALASDILINTYAAAELLKPS